MSVVEVRPYDPELEENFLFDSWLKSFKPSRYAGPVQGNLYWKMYRESVQQLLEQWGVSVLMAYCPDDSPPDDLYGYICYEEGFSQPVIHYVYVKDKYRGRGVMRLLMKQAGITGPYWYTYNVADSSKIFKNGLWKRELITKKKPEPEPNSKWHTREIQTFQTDPKRAARRERARSRGRK